MDFRARDSLPLAAARPRIAAMIENNVKRDDFRRPQPERGYTAGAFISNVMKSRGISLRIHSAEMLGETPGWRPEIGTSFPIPRS